MVDLTRKRAKQILVGSDFTCQPHRQHGAAMKPAIKSNNTATPGVCSGNFYTVLYRFSTGGHIDCFLGCVAWRKLVQFFGQFHSRFIRRHHHAGMAETRKLLLNSGHHLRV